MTSLGSRTLRVTAHCVQGGRKYMEDRLSVSYQADNTTSLDFVYFGVFDGHGGAEAANYAKKHLMNTIIQHDSFWSNDDKEVISAIREGFVATHHGMWRDLDKWPKTTSGLPSTAGTTATIAFAMRGKLYIGHVGDSGLILGYQKEDEHGWSARRLTYDHKPECKAEKTRIQNSGGKVILKSGVPRVVWNRPRIGHRGPVRRSTPIDEIPFLAVARSLGDLWSYNSELNEFVVSPIPDIHCIDIDPSFRCLIFGSDGLWNMLSPKKAVDIVNVTELKNESCEHGWINPSIELVEDAHIKWDMRNFRADNISAITVLLFPPKYESTGKEKVHYQYPMVLQEYDNAVSYEKQIIEDSQNYTIKTNEFEMIYNPSPSTNINKSKHKSTEKENYSHNNSFQINDHIQKLNNYDDSIQVSHKHLNAASKITVVGKKLIPPTMLTRRMTKSNDRVTRSKKVLKKLNKKTMILASSQSTLNSLKIKRKTSRNKK